MSLSRTFRVSGALTAAGILLVAIGGSGGLRALGVLFLVFAGPVFAVSAVRHLLRGLLWRVGSRLLVSYLLVGVVPIPFLLGLLLLGAAALSGQLGARRAVDAITARAATMERTARDVANGAPAADLAALHADALPGLAALAAPAGAPGSPPSTHTVVVQGPSGWKLVTTAALPRGGAVLTLPLEDPLGAALSRETGIDVAFFHTRTETTTKGTTIHLDVKSGPTAGAPVSPASRPAPGAGEERGLLRGSWVHWIAPLPWDVRAEGTGAAVPDERAIVTVKTSIAGELSRLFAGAKFSREEGTDTGAFVLMMAKVLVSLVVFVYLAAAAISAVLVLRVARAARRLSQGLAAVERGDFAYRATLRGSDQLSALVNGFNDMAAHLSQSVAERAQREALEHELAVARDLQRRLLPPADFAFPGLEISTDFRPAAAIGGDFYHLLPESPTRLSVVIADVSGHGLPTGIVMASAKASLSALAAIGMDAPALLTHLDTEIRQSTESRTFVTLAHLRFDLAARTVAYTNAGHVYPWVVRADGTVTAVANPARPLGVALPASFHTVTAPVATGDLWVLVSDGIVEAHAPGGEELGFERVEAVLRASAGGTAAALSARLLDAWRAHTGTDEPEDDRTLLVLRVL